MIRRTISNLRASRTETVVVGSVILWLLIFFLGTRLPYLRTEFSVQVRAFGVFPVALAAFAILAIRNNTLGDGCSLPEKLIYIGKASLGVLLVSALFAWSSIAYTSVATYLFARKPYSNQLQVLDVRRDRWRVKLQLLDPRIGEISLMAHRKSVDSIGSTGVVCVTGRQWLLGVVVNQVSADKDRCRADETSAGRPD